MRVPLSLQSVFLNRSVQKFIIQYLTKEEIILGIVNLKFAPQIMIS